MNRTDLLNQIYEARTRLETLLAKWEPHSLATVQLANGWSLKDLLAHLGWWENHATNVYRALAAGQMPEHISGDEQVNALNHQTLADFRARDVDEVRAYERQAFYDLVNIVETAPEEDLFDPQRFAWTEGRPFMDIIGWDTFNHYPEHFPDLEKLAVGQQAAQPTGAGAPVAADKASPILLKASQFLQQEGRDIEQAIFDHHFGSLALEELLNVLARYQNEDGGFFGLEVDIQAPQSNPFATELALSTMVWADAPRDHPVVQRTIAYLENTLDDEGNWRFAPEIYQHNLAPWFQGWQWPNLNPSCTISGLLKQLGLGSDRLHTRVQALFEHLAKPQDLTGSEYYNARPYAYYLQTEWSFPQAELYRWGVAWWLVHQHYNNPQMDATHFVDFARTPASAISQRLPAQVIKAQLERLAREQSEDGGWPTPYDPHWRGWNTVHNLLVLRAHGVL